MCLGARDHINTYVNDKDSKLIYEVYEDMPPQCPPRLLEEGWAHQPHSWILTDAIPKIKEMVKKNPKTVIAAGGLAALLVAKFGLDPDTAQTAVDKLEPGIVDQFEVSGDIMPGGDTNEIPSHSAWSDTGVDTSRAPGIDPIDAAKDRVRDWKQKMMDKKPTIPGIDKKGTAPGVDF